MKSAGKRLALRLTARFNLPASAIELVKVGIEQDFFKAQHLYQIGQVLRMGYGGIGCKCGFGGGFRVAMV
jgi:hypothetical protein